MTYDSKDIILELLRNDGTYPGDPQMARIYSYNGIPGNELYAVFMHETHDDVQESPYVRNPVMLWDRTLGLTEQGRAFLDANKESVTT